MILVDSSVWIDHLRGGDATLVDLLERGSVIAHPFVVGEIALGNLRQRDSIVSALLDLPHASVARDYEVRKLISRHQLHGRGIGYIAAHLLAAVRLTPGATLWTRDRRLKAVAEDLNVGAMPELN